MNRTAIVIVHYQSVSDTMKCIESINQTQDIRLILIIDNGSRHGDICKALIGYHNVKVIRNKQNLGFGRGNNLGIRWVIENEKYEFVFLLNNDTIIDPGTISVLEKTMDSFPNSAIVSPKIVLMENPDKLWYGGGEVDWWRGKGKIPGFLGPSDAPLASRSRAVTFVSGCAMFIRLSVLEIIGGFDPRFFLYEEDVELGLRAQETGWFLRYDAQSVVRHKVHGGQDDRSTIFLPALHPQNPSLPFFAYHMTRNQLLNMYLHAKGINKIRFWIGFPLFLARNCLRYFFANKWEAIQNVLKGIFDYILCKNNIYINELKD